jgi:hypothetical protein
MKNIEVKIFNIGLFPLPRALGTVVQRGIERGLIQNLFIVLQIPKTSRFLGVSGTPPLIGLDGSGASDGLPNDAPIFGQSFSSPVVQFHGWRQDLDTGPELQLQVLAYCIQASGTAIKILTNP